jgi:hypothetical protein
MLGRGNRYPSFAAYHLGRLLNRAAPFRFAFLSAFSVPRSKHPRPSDACSPFHNPLRASAGADSCPKASLGPLPQILFSRRGSGSRRHTRWAFRIIWRNVSELFGVVSALRRNASQTVAATNMAAIHKLNQIFTPIVGATLGSREGTLVLPRRSSGLSGTPNSSQTLRHIAIKATIIADQLS